MFGLDMNFFKNHAKCHGQRYDVIVCIMDCHGS